VRAKIAFGAMAALGVVASVAIYTRSKPHGELPRPPEGSGAHLATGSQGGGSGSALETPWLSREATEQVVGKDGALGLVFAGVVLGGQAPTAAVRTRIADFARANDVAIDFELAGDKLVAVRFTVTFGGCCGYEGADKLGLRFQRPHFAAQEGQPEVWANEWTIALPDGTHASVDLRFARVSVRWERTITTQDLIERADALIGTDPATIKTAAGDRWRTIADGHRYLLEVPYPFMRYFGGPLSERFDLGVVVDIEGGTIHEVVMRFDNDDERIEPELDKLARARWGAPRIRDDDRVWRTRTRNVTRGYRTLKIGAP
jgi:hypothetical protein